MRQSAHPVEGGDANWGNGSFEPTGEHDLGMPAADRLISLPNVGLASALVAQAEARPTLGP